MMTKKIITASLLLFVGVSLLVAVADVLGWRQSVSTQNAETDAEQDVSSTVDPDTQARYVAICFHAPHRCPTCIKIEAYAHEALKSEIERGHIVWKVADYTAEENQSVVKHCKVFTSTVVLMDRQNGNIVRWENLEDVWNHTNDQHAFTTFIDEAWKRFQEASAT